MGKGEGIRGQGKEKRGKVGGERFVTTVWISFGTQLHVCAKE